MSDDLQQSRWQRRNLTALTDLLAETDLPVLTWTISPFSLLGQALGPYARGERRRAFDAWVQLTGADVWANMPADRLHAVADRWGPHQVKIILTATLLSDL